MQKNIVQCQATLFYALHGQRQGGGIQAIVPALKFWKEIKVAKV
jgi:hypothetical protein